MSSREENIMADAQIIRQIVGDSSALYIAGQLAYRNYRAFVDSMKERHRKLPKDEVARLEQVIDTFNTTINYPDPAMHTKPGQIPSFWQVDGCGVLTMGIDRDVLIDEFEKELVKLSRRYDKTANDGYRIAFQICNRVIECIKDERSRLRKQRWFLKESRTAWFGEPPSAYLLVLIELFNWATDILPCFFDKCMPTSGSEPVINTLEKRKAFYEAFVDSSTRTRSTIRELLPHVPGQENLNSAPYPTVMYVKDHIQKGAANLRANKEREGFVEHIKQLSREMAQAADVCMLSYSVLMSNEHDVAPRFVDDDYISPGKEEHGGYPSTLLFRRGIALFRELGIEDLTQHGKPISPDQLHAFEKALAKLDDSYLSNPSEKSLSAHNTGLDDALFIKDPRAAKDFLHSQGLDPNKFYPGVPLILKPKLAVLTAHADNIKHATRLLATARAFCDFTSIRLWNGECWSLGSTVGKELTKQMAILARKNIEDLKQSSEILSSGFMTFAGPFVKSDRYSSLTERHGRVKSYARTTHNRLSEADRLLRKIEALAENFARREQEVGEIELRLCRFIPEFKKLCGLSGDWPFGSRLVAQAQPASTTPQEPPTRQHTLFSSPLWLIRRLTGTQAQPATDAQDPPVVGTESQVANTRPDRLSLLGLIEDITQMSPGDARLPAFQLELGCQMMAGILTRLSTGVSVTSNVDNPIPRDDSAMVKWLRAAANGDNSRALTVSHGSFWGKYRAEKYEQLTRWLAENLHNIPLDTWRRLAQRGRNLIPRVLNGTSAPTDIDELIALLGHHTNPVKRLMIDTLGSYGGFSDQSFGDTRSLAAFKAKLQEFQRHYEGVEEQKSHADEAVTSEQGVNNAPGLGAS